MLSHEADHSSPVYWHSSAATRLDTCSWVSESQKTGKSIHAGQLLWHRSRRFLSSALKRSRFIELLESDLTRSRCIDLSCSSRHVTATREEAACWLRPHDLGSKTRRRRLKTAACAAGPLMISLWSSVLFSQQTAAHCLLLGRIKLCVLVGCCGGGGRAFLCDMGHWLLFHSSGTIMRFFFFFQNISAAIQRSDCVYEIVHTSLNAGAGEGKAIFKTLANCFLLLCRDW